VQLRTRFAPAQGDRRDRCGGSVECLSGCGCDDPRRHQGTLTDLGRDHVAHVSEVRPAGGDGYFETAGTGTSKAPDALIPWDPARSARPSWTNYLDEFTFRFNSRHSPPAACSSAASWRAHWRPIPSPRRLSPVNRSHAQPSSGNRGSEYVLLAVVVGVAGVHGERGYRCAVVAGLRPAAASPLQRGRDQLLRHASRRAGVREDRPGAARPRRLGDEFVSVEDGRPLETKLGAAGVGVRVLRGRPTRLP
jgi:hypothetical protein